MLKAFSSGNWWTFQRQKLHLYLQMWCWNRGTDCCKQYWSYNLKASWSYSSRDKSRHDSFVIL